MLGKLNLNSPSEGRALNGIDPADKNTSIPISTIIGDLDSYLARLQNNTKQTASEINGVIICTLMLLQPVGSFPVFESTEIVDSKVALMDASIQMGNSVLPRNIAEIRGVLIKLSQKELQYSSFSFFHAIRLLLRLEEKKKHDKLEAKGIYELLEKPDSNTSIRNVRLALTSIIQAYSQTLNEAYPNDASEIYGLAEAYKNEILKCDGEDTDLTTLDSHKKLVEACSLTRTARIAGSLAWAYNALPSLR